jgi:hypothetical protein
MKTTQDGFHTMRGHVADGCEIAMANGDTLTLKAVINGWQLVDQTGRNFGLATNSAHVIACLVFAHPSEDI